jgi:hypothetical protein
MGAVHGINAILILAIALHVIRPFQRLESWTLRAVALLIGVSGAGFVSLLGTTTNDLLESIFVLASLLGLLKVGRTPRRPYGLVRLGLPGLSAGIGVGLKYTAVIFVPGLALIALITAIRHKTARGLIVFGAASLVGFLAAAGHHLLTLWLDFGNPVFPLLNNVFQSPYYDVVSIRDEQYLPRDFWQAIAYPFYWAKTNRGLVSELPLRDWRGGIAYIAIAAVLLTLAASCVRRKHPRGGMFAETRDLGLVFIFVIVSHFIWEVGFGVYRYAVALEMLTGVVSMGALIWLIADHRLRIGIAVALLTIAAMTTVHPDWGRGQYGEKYVDVRVPPLPANAVVLIATWDPAAYFIPFAEPTAQYLGIENNYLDLSQSNKLASEVNRLMRAPGRAKFVLSVGEFDPNKLNRLLGRFGLRLSGAPCQPIHSNLEAEALSLCPAVAE